MANGGQMPQGSAADRLESKIDALSNQLKIGLDGVEARLDGMETRLDGVETRFGDVETRLGGVQSELRDVKTELAGVGERLTRVEILAKGTDKFSNNLHDSLESLRREARNGFKAAKKENEEQFRLVKLAIHDWGRRVQRVESAQEPPLKRS